MKKFQFWIAGFLLLAYTLYFQVPFTLLKHPERLTYLRYDKLFNDLGIISVLFVFLLILGITSSVARPETDSVLQVRRWWIGFVGVIAPLLVFSLYVNPHGIFSWNPLSSSAIAAFIPTAARNEKVTLFDRQSPSPEVVVLGSSRAFTISSSYIMERTGYRTFNMAVNGGGPLDFLTFGRFVLSKDDTPAVLMVELVVPSLKVRENPMPVSMIPYLDYQKGLDTTNSAFLDVFSFQSISDTVYQVTFAILAPQQPAMVFMPDGTGVRVPITEEEYKIGLQRVTDHLNRTYKCRSLDANGRYQLEQLVELAAEHQTAILFYRSPLNADFLDAADGKHPDYIKCESLFNDYMANMVTTHTNVFFHDLTYYEPIGSLRWTGYFDAHHLKPIAAQLLIDALAGDIQAAGEWADRERSLNQSR